MRKLNSETLGQLKIQIYIHFKCRKIWTYFLHMWISGLTIIPTSYHFHHHRRLKGKLEVQTILTEQEEAKYVEKKKAAKVYFILSWLHFTGGWGGREVFTMFLCREQRVHNGLAGAHPVMACLLSLWSTFNNTFQ